VSVSQGQAEWAPAKRLVESRLIVHGKPFDPFAFAQKCVYFCHPLNLMPRFFDG
jgi:hypothetical protein